MCSPSCHKVCMYQQRRRCVYMRSFDHNRRGAGILLVCHPDSHGGCTEDAECPRQTWRQYSNWFRTRFKTRKTRLRRSIKSWMKDTKYCRERALSITWENNNNEKKTDKILMKRIERGSPRRISKGKKRHRNKEIKISETRRGIASTSRNESLVMAASSKSLLTWQVVHWIVWFCITLKWQIFCMFKLSTLVLLLSSSYVSRWYFKHH